MRKDQTMAEAKETRSTGIEQVIEVNAQTIKELHLAGTFRGRELREGDFLYVGYPCDAPDVDDGTLVLTFPPGVKRIEETFLAWCQKKGKKVVAIPNDTKEPPFVARVVWPVLMVSLAV